MSSGFICASTHAGGGALAAPYSLIVSLQALLNRGSIVAVLVALFDVGWGAACGVAGEGSSRVRERMSNCAAGRAERQPAAVPHAARQLEPSCLLRLFAISAVCKR